MKTGRYSLAQLLNSDFVDCIIIPEMQRDYVWTVDNVDGLFNSIETNFLRKKKLQLSISNNGEIIDDASRNYLTKEYERLRFNTRIGFIYAYYDASDSRVLYLIDGQQRITTLFLLLLAVYTMNGAESCSEFRKKYFANNIPRLDYRVRENAHNYLVDFIDFVLKHPDGDFAIESGRIYADYSFDPTIISIQKNYDRIRERLQNSNGNISELLDYVENFVEFNYFDTGLSHQGERLYLYMNSRGEGLSLQEDIKPVIISRCVIDKKIEGGLKWEKWQNFFWRHRENSPNSDNGFWGFLKLSVILHQAHFNFQWESYTSENSGIRSQKDVREVFINKNYIAEQHRWVHRYILENRDFNIHWIEECFDAYERLSELYDRSKDKSQYPYPILRIDEWRSVESFANTIHYVAVCGLLEIMISQPDITDDNLYRFGMYLLNRSDDSNNSKDPASATLRAIALAMAMSDVKMLDIRQLRRCSDITRDNENMDCTGSILWEHIDSKEWEELFWEITVANPELNRFFNGCHDILIKLSDEDNNYTIQKVREIKKLFIEKFFRHREEKSLRKALLAYGDISISGGNNTWNFGEEMERWKLPEGEEWLQFLGNDKKLDIVRRFLNDAPKSSEGWCIALGNAVDYMKNYRYLWRRSIDHKILPNIVLLKAKQAKETLSCSLPSHLLAKAIGGWNWKEDHRYADLDFIIENGIFKTVNPGEGTYAFDFIFHWNSDQPYWDVVLKKRGDSEFSEVEIGKLMDTWEKVASNSTELSLRCNNFKETEGYLPDGSLKSIEQIKNWLDNIKNTLVDKLEH